MKEQTVKDIVEFNGIGVHSGVMSRLKLLPSESGGIVFKNDNGQTIQALFSNVVETSLGTTISNGQMTVKTIEHFMAGVFYCGLDNVVVEISSEEVPILDGSSKIFVEEIKKVGVKSLENNRKYLKILKPIEFVDGDKFLKVFPSEDFSIDVTVDFPYGNIGKQHLLWNGQEDTFFARTFCNQKEIDYMRSVGLAKGGSLDNAMVFDDNGIINEGGLRMNNEVVNHKTLDCIGDLLTAGHYIKGRIVAEKPGHAMNNKFLRKLFEDESNYSIE
jgi:UDP-3-O-[3-hydroxymyristoyl] N-acetylglucosamine deacetylase